MQICEALNASAKLFEQETGRKFAEIRLEWDEFSLLLAELNVGITPEQAAGARVSLADVDVRLAE